MDWSANNNVTSLFGFKQKQRFLLNSALHKTFLLVVPVSPIRTSIIANHQMDHVLKVTDFTTPCWMFAFIGMLMTTAIIRL